ncbi:MULTISPECIES: MerR family transcriptional regulator [unclassified Microbacterium]|uniref:MerR family transcriptional regulator n=1 Tax=unclassified Microbacterium TaxID=2609290 RepID=UPI0012F968F8|nr:MerR family transcriptional regulator [Microbacterium sp. MAH-37]
MKLSEFARTTGATTATLKFWMREGVLPAGELRNQTTAVYGQRHLDRVALIQTLRAEFDMPIAGIRDLTALIDRTDVVPLDVMEACQVIATGLAVGEAHDEYAELIGELHDRVGWIRFDSLAAGVLANALAASARVGYPYRLEVLEQYARMLDPIAEADLGAIHPEGTLDVMARNLLVAAAAQNRVLVAMNQLAHTAAAVRLATRP